jgi:hypothetical protein
MNESRTKKKNTLCTKFTSTRSLCVGAAVKSARIVTVCIHLLISFAVMASRNFRYLTLNRRKSCSVWVLCCVFRKRDPRISFRVYKVLPFLSFETRYSRMWVCQWISSVTRSLVSQVICWNYRMPCSNCWRQLFVVDVSLLYCVQAC